MLPFAVLGFVMKPLQLKGAFSACNLFLMNSIFITFAISKDFVDAGFAQGGSNKGLTAVDTLAVEDQGTFRLIFIEGFHLCLVRNILH